MDKKEKGKGKGRWFWVREAMPGVARLMAERREKYGAAWVEECWKRGMRGEPGWLFAREGAVSIGTPDLSDPVMADFAAATITSTQALVVMREPGVGDGAH